MHTLSITFLKIALSELIKTPSYQASYAHWTAKFSKITAGYCAWTSYITTPGSSSTTALYTVTTTHSTCTNAREFTYIVQRGKPCATRNVKKITLSCHIWDVYPRCARVIRRSRCELAHVWCTRTLKTCAHHIS